MRTENGMPLSIKKAPRWLLPNSDPGLGESGVERERASNSAPAASELKGL